MQEYGPDTDTDTRYLAKYGPDTVPMLVFQYRYSLPCMCFYQSYNEDIYVTTCS